jgi:hypothetical protein
MTASQTDGPDDHKAVFADHTVAAELLEAAYAQGDGAPAVVPTSRLYAYATGRLHRPDLAIERALRFNADLRAAYMRMIVGNAMAVSEVAMAASSDAFPERLIHSTAPELEHRLRVVEDKGRHFLILELDSRASLGQSLSLGVLDRETGERDVISLPAPVQGAIQLRLATSAPLFALLRRADTLLTLESD